MMSRSRSGKVLLITFGFFLLIIGIVELANNSHADNIVITSFGIYLIATNGFEYVFPDSRATTRTLLAALGSFLLCLVVAFFVFYRYSQAGLFSTFGSTMDVLWVIFLFFMSILFVYRYFSLIRQEQR